MTNFDRSENARFKIAGYSGEPDDLETDLYDFLTDLRHMAAQHGLDFNEAIARSRMHFKAEQQAERKAA